MWCSQRDSWSRVDKTVVLITLKQVGTPPAFFITFANAIRMQALLSEAS